MFHIVVLVNEMRQRTIEMNFFKQGKSVPLQTGRVRSLRTRAPFVLIRPAHRMSAVPPRQVPTEEPPASPVEMPPDAPELPEPTPPGIPGVPPDEAPDTTPSEMPPEVGCGSSTHPGSLAIRASVELDCWATRANVDNTLAANRADCFSTRWTTVGDRAGRNPHRPPRQALGSCGAHATREVVSLGCLPARRPD